jgi:hypothetical protein
LGRQMYCFRFLHSKFIFQNFEFFFSALHSPFSLRFCWVGKSISSVVVEPNNVENFIRFFLPVSLLPFKERCCFLKRVQMYSYISFAQVLSQTFFSTAI